MKKQIINIEQVKHYSVKQLANGVLYFIAYNKEQVRKHCAQNNIKVVLIFCQYDNPFPNVTYIDLTK